MPRLPSVRHPKSFFDVFSVSVAAISVVALALALWHGSFVRVEMAAFVIVVFLWAMWAVTQILKHSVEHSNRTR